MNFQKKPKKKTSKQNLCNISFIFPLFLLSSIFGTVLMTLPDGRSGICTKESGFSVPPTDSSNAPLSGEINGDGNPLSLYTSFVNISSGSVLVRNSFPYIQFHNGTISVPQVPGYEACRVNISVPTGKTTAITERNATTTAPMVDSIPVSDNFGTFQAVADDFYMPLLANISTIKAYLGSSGTITGFIDIQWRNGSLGSNIPDLRWNESIAAGLGADWQSFDLISIDPANLTFPGVYYVVVNSTYSQSGSGSSVDVYYDHYNAGGGLGPYFYFPWFQTNYLTDDRYNAMGYRIEYLPVDPANPSQNATFSVEDCALAVDDWASPNYLTSDNWTVVERPQGLSITTLTLTSNISCNISYALEVTYRAITPISVPMAFTAVLDGGITWNVTTTASINFPAVPTYNWSFNLTGFPAGWSAGSPLLLNSSTGTGGWVEYTVTHTDFARQIISVESITEYSYWQFNLTSPSDVSGATVQASSTPVVAGDIISFPVSAVITFPVGSTANVTVYQPTSIGNGVVWSGCVTGLSGTIVVGAWDTNDPSLVYGIYRIRASVNGTFCAGFVSGTFELVGPVDVNLDTPAELLLKDDQSVQISLDDPFKGLDIIGSTLTYQWDGGTGPSGTAINKAGTGHYSITLDTSSWTAGNHILTVTSTKSGYNTTSKTFTIRVAASYLANLTIISVYPAPAKAGEAITALVFYERVITRTGIPAATITVANQTDTMISLVSNGTDGYYTGSFPATWLLAGSNQLTFSASATDFESKSVIQLIEIEPADKPNGNGSDTLPPWTIGVTIGAVGGVAVLAGFLVMRKKRFRGY